MGGRGFLHGPQGIELRRTFRIAAFARGSPDRVFNSRRIVLMEQRTYLPASWRLQPPATRPQISLRLMSFSTRGRPRPGLWGPGADWGLRIADCQAPAGEFLSDCGCLQQLENRFSIADCGFGIADCRKAMESGTADSSSELLQSVSKPLPMQTYLDAEPLVRTIGGLYRDVLPGELFRSGGEISRTILHLRTSGDLAGSLFYCHLGKGQKKGQSCS